MLTFCNDTLVLTTHERRSATTILRWRRYLPLPLRTYLRSSIMYV